MIIRKARLRDIPEIGKLWTEFRKDHDRIILKGGPKMKPYIERKSDALEEFKKYLKKNIHSKNAGVIIAEIDGKPIGYTLFLIKKNVPIFKTERLGLIGDLFVKEPFRGRGISSLFKEEAARFFKRKGIKHMSLMVSATNSHAHGVYSRWGFQDYHMEMRRRI